MLPGAELVKAVNLLKIKGNSFSTKRQASNEKVLKVLE
jgi:hypothetical protein